MGNIAVPSIQVRLKSPFGRSGFQRTQNCYSSEDGYDYDDARPRADRATRDAILKPPGWEKLNALSSCPTAV